MLTITELIKQAKRLSLIFLPSTSMRLQHSLDSLNSSLVAQFKKSAKV